MANVTSERPCPECGQPMDQIRRGATLKKRGPAYHCPRAKAELQRDSDGILDRPPGSKHGYGRVWSEEELVASAATELIVLTPVADGRLYPVQSGDHVWYVDISSGECDCPAFWFQSAENRRLCKHSRKVARQLKEAGQCPACRGKGRIMPTGAVRYVGRDGKVDMRPLECMLCSGTGKR